jgi:hypothetical protein
VSIPEDSITKDDDEFQATVDDHNYEGVGEIMNDHYSPTLKDMGYTIYLSFKFQIIVQSIGQLFLSSCQEQEWSFVFVAQSCIMISL